MIAEVRALPGRLTNTETALRHGWHPVALSSEVRDEPMAVHLLGEAWVVARLDDRLAAFADQCPHRLAPLSAGHVERHELVCGYHGWRFVASGECTAVPALGPGVPAPRRARATPPWGIVERHGVVWLAPDEPFTDVIELPEADRAEADGTEADGAGFDSAWLAVSRTSACAGLLADNFLDTAHFPFVHAATIGADEATLVPPYQVSVDSDGQGFTVRLEQEVANPEDPGVAAGLRPLVQRRWSTYVYRAPFMMRLRMEYPDAGTVSSVFFALQPEDEASTRIYTRILRDDLAGDTAKINEAVRFEQAILDEDLALQERFTIDGLPLLDRGDETVEEVSVRSDAAGIALRRILGAFVARAEQLNSAPGGQRRNGTGGAANRRYARRPSTRNGR